MPKRTDLTRILLIGSGPIVVGQACEYDCSGTQGVKALKEEHYEVVLVNADPATIMTDPDLADRTYIEPVEPETVARIIRKERPDALLPTLGGRTALNTARILAQAGVLQECGVELLGVTAKAIETAASRELFRQTMLGIGLTVPEGGLARTMDDVRRFATSLSFPLIARPAFTLGGAGSGIAHRAEDLEAIAAEALAVGQGGEATVEQALPGWKEFELEVMRDRNDTCMIVCSIENLDPVGVHSGDSIAVAPAQTLTGVEYRRMRNAAIAVVRAIGVEAGCASVRFGVNPADGALAVIGMHPRASRSSALASKATGFPIARIATKLAMGYTLDELRSDIAHEISAGFEPVADYCVIKIPRFASAAFPGSRDALTPSMHSVGETMAIGRTFKEALQKGLRSLAMDMPGLGHDFRAPLPQREDLVRALRTPHSGRIFALRQAFLAGFSPDAIHRFSGIDPWFLHQIEQLTLMESRIRDFALANALTPDNPELREVLREAKMHGFSDRQLAAIWKRPEPDIRTLRKTLGIAPTYYPVDTCAAAFEARASYFYATYEGGSEVQAERRKKVIVLGGGPHRSGQDIAYDFCCCHACRALKDAGVQAIMINANPGAVSTDCGVADRLYCEPLTFEDVMHVVALERPDGIIVQFGGRTSLDLAAPLLRAGAPILGASPDAVDRTEDRERFQALIRKLDLLQPASGAANAHKALQTAGCIADAEALADGSDVYVAGIMEHSTQAGVHSGGSPRVLPPHSLPVAVTDAISRQTVALARELRVVGLMNVRFAIENGRIAILRVNLHASRAVPFVSKATGVPLPRLATQVMLGRTLKELDPWGMRRSGWVSVKDAVVPLRRFPGADLPPDSGMPAGQVMGIGPTFAEALRKSRIAAGHIPPPNDDIAVRSIQEYYAACACSWKESNL